MALITRSSLRRGYFLIEGRVRNTPLDQEFDVFLSHSYADAKSVQSLIEKDLLDLKHKFLTEYNLSVYVDWIVDSHLDRSHVDATTASVLRVTMDHCRCLIYVTTDQSANSKWMPWELGYFDGKKGRVAILPVVDNHMSSYNGQEYLSLYPYVDEVELAGSSKPALRVNHVPAGQVPFVEWLNREKPAERLEDE